ncbi:MAG: hypothetical protein LBB63_02015 [Holosporaceae bacterium]|jgi:hypothetical protein|nr:hypothetical protein [Holosporaceae bacterium]
MKFRSSLVALLAICSCGEVFSVPGARPDIAPKVYSDISQTAQDDAVSFDGIRMIVGLCLAFNSFDASTGNVGAATGVSITSPSLSMVMEYSKAFRKGFLLGITMGARVSKKSSKDGSWADLNKQYENARGAAHAGNHTGTLEKDSFNPEVALKAGYQLSGYSSMLYAKVGVVKVNGVYHYQSNGAKICDVDVNAMLPTIWIGAERKINKKWGASLEASISIGRQSKQPADTVEHRIKMSRKEFSILAVYSISSH